jgi:hypothetical protein
MTGWENAGIIGAVKRGMRDAVKRREKTLIDHRQGRTIGAMSAS